MTAVEALIATAITLVCSGLMFWRGYAAGKADATAEHARLYADLCRRLIEAIKRRENE